MTEPSLVQRQHTARLLHEFTRPATAAIVAQASARPGVATPIDTVRRRSGLSGREFWTTVRRLETLGVLVRSDDDLLLDHDQLDRVAGTLVADSPLNSIMVGHPRLTAFVQWGRVTRMPIEPAVIDELYEVLARLFGSGETLIESEVNARIGLVHDDPAEVRRALADRRLLRRDPGSGVYLRP